jgi:hypothetical protein
MGLGGCSTVTHQRAAAINRNPSMASSLPSQDSSNMLEWEECTNQSLYRIGERKIVTTFGKKVACYMEHNNQIGVCLKETNIAHQKNVRAHKLSIP